MMVQKESTPRKGVQEELTTRTTIQLHKDISKLLGKVADAEQPPTTKLLEVKFLVDRRYAELKKQGRFK
jgi:hypothetical protein